ncbi:MAG TPA: hypothetical protein VJQ49_08565 [Casimicrobiaceae bacterium]|nr:hypothetical protein [Casimicrobiaceae bacterium]
MTEAPWLTDDAADPQLSTENDASSIEAYIDAMAAARVTNVERDGKLQIGVRKLAADANAG